MNRLELAVVPTLIWVLVGGGAASAATTVWGFNASFGNPHIQAYDLATGSALADFAAPHKDANRGRANGRGIAIAGGSIYYTLADTPNVYRTDPVTHADLGIAFTTSLTPGINSLAWDGASFWMSASQPADPTKPADDKVYQYSPSGKLLQTVVLPRPVNTNLARDGIEVTPFGIVANRASFPYDIYDMSGRMKQALFLTGPYRATGIAFDGVNYIVSDVFNGRLAVYDTGGNLLRSVALTGADIPYGIMDLAVDPAAVSPATPRISSGGVVNAASYAGGPIAPGEILAIFGAGLGPETLATLRLNAAGAVDTSLAGTRVLFDGVAAPVIYTLGGQVSVAAPYSVANRASAQVVVEYAGVPGAAVTVPVAPSAPAMFTADGSGAGPGAILNEDGSVNSAANPARRGSVVTIFATGEGQTSPGGVDGKLAVVPLPAPALPVGVTVDNLAADVLYAGGAPTLVAGVLQVNIRVPAGARPGSAPVMLHIGASASQPGVTVAIQ